MKETPMYAFEISEEIINTTVSDWDLGPVLLTHGAAALVESGQIDLDSTLGRHHRAARAEGWPKPDAAERSSPQFLSFTASVEVAILVVSQRGAPDSPVQRDQTIICLGSEYY